MSDYNGLVSFAPALSITMVCIDGFSFAGAPFGIGKAV